MSDASALVARLRRAYQTACNDDYSKPGTEERARHVERLTAIDEAAAFIDSTPVHADLDAIEATIAQFDTSQGFYANLAALLAEVRRLRDSDGRVKR